MKLAEAKMNLILNNRVEKQDWSYSLRKTAIVEKMKATMINID